MREKIRNIIYDWCLTRGEQVLALEEFLADKGYYEAPAAAKNHNNFEGGLALHSWNVYKTAIAIKHSICNGLSGESVVICSLFHDAHKVCDVWGNKTYLPNVLKSGETSEKKPYVVNKEKVASLPAYMSGLIVMRFVELADDEYQAIIGHDGQYVVENRALVHKEEPLTLILHWADMWSASQIERADSGFHKLQTEVRHGKRT